MKQVDKKTGRRRGRVFQRLAMAAIIVFPIALIALWLTFQHKPDWYRPATLNEAGIQRSKKSAVELADFISDKIVEGYPFEVVLTETDVNEWLAAIPDAWPGVQDELPSTVSDIAVRFEPDYVWMGALWEDRGWKAILGLKLELSMAGDQQGIDLRLVSATGGSLPAPRALLERLLDRHLYLKPETEFTVARLSSFYQLHSTAQLFDGLTMTNRGVWFNGRRRFEITSLALEQGDIRLTIEPL